MPEVTQETQVTEDLDQRVESLLKQMEDAAKRAAAIATETEADEAAAAGPATPVESDLASQVDQLLAEAASGSAPAEAPQSIGSLDDELAKLASELIEGDVEGDAPPPPAIRPAPSAPAAAPLREVSRAPAAPDPTIGDPPVVRRHAASLPKPTPPAPPKTPLWRRVISGAKVIAGATIAAVRRHTPTLLAFLEPIAYRIAALISSPLRNRPALVRDAVGWVALGTTFWASCLFVYFMFIFEPEAPHPTSAAVGLVDPAKPEAEHEPAEAAHEAKKEAPKEAPKESGGHESGGHEGGGEKKAEAKKSPLHRPTGNPLGMPAKKPEKKEGGHGEE